jgi:hypothetical protein
MLTYGEDEQWVGFKPEAVFENSAQGGNSDMRDSVDFWKIQKKIHKIQENSVETHWTRRSNS